MFRREAVRQRHRLVGDLAMTMRAVRGERRRDDVASRRQLVDDARDALGEAALPGDEDRARVGIVLGLRDEIGGDPRRLAARRRR